MKVFHDLTSSQYERSPKQFQQPFAMLSSRCRTLVPCTWGIQTALRPARDAVVSSLAFWNSFMSLNCCLSKYQFAHLAIQFLEIEVESISEINCL